MRAAPPVHMACGPDARWRLACRSLWTLAAATVVAWGALHAGLSMAPIGLAIGLAAGIAWFASARWAGPMSIRPLTWDGRQWALQGQPGSVSVMLDFGSWVLLRFRSKEQTQWLATDLRHCGTPPGLCRAALLAHAGRAAGDSPLAP